MVIPCWFKLFELKCASIEYIFFHQQKPCIHDNQFLKYCKHCPHRALHWTSSENVHTLSSDINNLISLTKATKWSELVTQMDTFINHCLLCKLTKNLHLPFSFDKAPTYPNALRYIRTDNKELLLTWKLFLLGTTKYISFHHIICLDFGE